MCFASEVSKALLYNQDSKHRKENERDTQETSTCLETLYTVHDPAGLLRSFSAFRCLHGKALAIHREAVMLDAIHHQTCLSRHYKAFQIHDFAISYVLDNVAGSKGHLDPCVMSITS